LRGKPGTDAHPQCSLFAIFIVFLVSFVSCYSLFTIDYSLILCYRLFTALVYTLLVKVLLIQPPIEDFYDTSIRTYPLALAYLAAAIRDICDVSIVDLRSNRRPKVINGHPFPDLQDYYRDIHYSPFALFRRYYRFGADRKEIEATIRQHAPDVVAITSSYTTYSLEAIEVAKIAKRVNTDIITVMGGTHPTLFPHHLLQSPYVDYVIRGEGETPLVSLIHALRSDRRKNIIGIPGVSSRYNGDYSISDIAIERDIDRIPARELLNPADYRIGGKDYTFFLTSRGCPFHCTFCGKPPVPYRKRAMGSIEREISSCIDSGIRAIDFEDDMLNLDLAFFNEVLSLLNGKGMTLSAMNGIYAETMDMRTLENMWDAGFRRLNFSLVDISGSIIEQQKRAAPANFLTLLPFLEASSFDVEIHFIIGLPDQRPEDITETILFLMGKRALLGPSIFYLAPGSRIFDEVSGSFRQGDIKTLRSSYMAPVNPFLPRDAIFTFMKLVRFVNVVKQLLDRDPGPQRLSDLLEAQCGRNGHDDIIMRTLLIEKRFIAYDRRTKDYVDEPQDRELIASFFKKISGATIKGFKTGNSLTIDL
jgi:anaerobic magnesium-protoporphyrin IX monomethyl ester cyclase